MSKEVLAAAVAVTLAIAAAPEALAAGPAWTGNPDWPTALTFEGTPPRARPRPGSACEVADAYVTLIASDRAKEVPALFAPDGEFIGVPDKVMRGPAEIATFYNMVHQGGAIPLSFIDAGPDCIMELAGQRPSPEPGQPDRYRLVAIDHFTITPGRKIKRLVIFFRPGAITLPH